MFVRDALRLTALSAAALVLLVTTLSRLGVSAARLQIPLLQLALFGVIFLSQKYVGRNLEWLLGLPHRKAALAWYNFALNLSLLSMAWAGVALVFGAGSLAAEDSSRRPFVLQPSRLLDLPALHGRALAVAVFVLTSTLCLCWNVSRPPDFRDFARRQRFLLLAWTAGVLGFVFLVTRAQTAPSVVVSPYVLFVAGTLALCLGTTYRTANTLGTSRRQRRTWMIVGGAIALAEALVLVTIGVKDLRCDEPELRDEAARLFGTAPGSLAP
jgi:hypothetical protein